MHIFIGQITHRHEHAILSAHIKICLEVTDLRQYKV